VFCNFFSEAEPFAAILIAHGTHVFFVGGLLRPIGSKFEAKGQEWGKSSWEGGSKPPSHQLGGLAERCKPRPQITFWTY